MIKHLIRLFSRDSYITYGKKVRPKRLGIVIPWFGQSLNGGAEKQAYKIGIILSEIGFNVDILTTCCLCHNSNWNKNYYKQGKTKENGLNIIRFKVDDLDTENLEKTNKSLLEIKDNRERRSLYFNRDISDNWIKDNINSKNLLNYLKANNGKYEHFILIPYLYGLIFRAINIIADKAWVHPCLHDESYAYLACTRDLFLKCEGILFNSVGEQILAQSLYGPLALLKGKVIGEFVNQPDLIDYSSNVNTNGKYILYIGKKTKEKGLDCVINAVLDFNENTGLSLNLFIIGQGYYEVNSKYIKDLGEITDAEKYKYIKNSLAVVVPGINESFSLTMHEAWSLKKAVIVNEKCFATKIAVESCNGGYIFNDDLPNVLENIYYDYVKLNKYGNNGYKYFINNCSKDTIRKNYKSVFFFKKNRFGFKVFQIIPNFAIGDAISEYCLTIAKWLLRRGIKNKILVLNYNQKYSKYTSSLEDETIQPHDVIIYHYSIGSYITEYLHNCGLEYSIIYHNITPPYFFKNYNDNLFDLCRKGIDELKTTQKYCKNYIAVSEYNANDLKKIGINNVQIIKLPISPKKWNCSLEKTLNDKLNNNKFKIIFVGRLSPNKNQLSLIDIFSILNKLHKNLELYIIGHGECHEKYTQEIIKKIKYLNLNNCVHLTFSVTNEQLFTYYRNADLFLCLSKHEGVCLPLLESMLFQVPVFALSNSAISETMSGCGILFDNNIKINILASKISNFINNKNARTDIIKKQNSYIYNYSLIDFEGMFFKVLNLN